MDFSLLNTDPKKEQDGVWVDVGEDARLLIARLGNPRYNELSQRLLRPYRHQIQTGRMKEEVMHRILCRIMADTVLLGWEGMTDNGVPVPYSRDEAYRRLLASRDFYRMVEGFANDMALFREDELAEAAEALGKSSDGSSDGDTGSPNPESNG